jgi:undecaprenyl phosphate-alpha-L-ara4N flippase subunit ArnF
LVDRAELKKLDMTSGQSSSEYAASRYRGGLWCALASVLLVSFAQLAMKYGMAHIDMESFRAVHSWRELLAALALLTLSTTAFPVFAGMLCYAVSVFCWMAALGRLPLNFAYPLLSLSYPLVYLGAALFPFFNETLNAQRLGGIALIMLGVILLMVKTDNETVQNKTRISKKKRFTKRIKESCKIGDGAENRLTRRAPPVQLE